MNEQRNIPDGLRHRQNPGQIKFSLRTYDPKPEHEKIWLKKRLSSGPLKNWGIKYSKMPVAIILWNF